MTFILPMPTSWNAAKRGRMDGMPHTQRPDLSNLVKAFEDALLKNDEGIHTYVGIKKIWGKEGRIVLHFHENGTFAYTNYANVEPGHEKPDTTLAGGSDSDAGNGRGDTQTAAGTGHP